MKKNLLKILGGLSAIAGYLASPEIFAMLPEKAAAVVTVVGGLVYIFTGRKPAER